MLKMIRRRTIWRSLYRQGGWGPKLNPGFTQNVNTVFGERLNVESG